MNFIKKFNQIGLKDVPLVGGKNASLGQMITDLAEQGIKVPMGFAITADAYWHFLNSNNLVLPLKKLRARISITDERSLAREAKHMRALIVAGVMPTDLLVPIAAAYQELSKLYNIKNVDVAVRSSATAEDLPGASFAGQQETFLHVRGIDSLIDACKRCFASLFTDRAIAYRAQQGFDDFDSALSIGVQKMVRSDLAASGVAFSLDTETGFKDVVTINASWGLGESIVQGTITPDEFIVHKPTLQKGYASIIKKKLGNKTSRIVYSGHALAQKPVPANQITQFCLTDAEILYVARAVTVIESHYSTLAKKWTPVDVEWAQDGTDKQIYIIQARPETVHAQEQHTTLIQYHLKSNNKPIHVVVTGQSIGQKIVAGKARVIKSLKQINQVRPGEILVTRMTDPDWVPALKKAQGIITDQGGRTCHAAIVSRELGIPAIVGTIKATDSIKTGEDITIDCSQGTMGYVYQGSIAYDVMRTPLDNLPKLQVGVMVNLADPDRAFTTSFLPCDGVGLARIEFIINTTIKIHPMALIHPTFVKDKKIQKQIEHITAGYKDKKQFFVDVLAQGIAQIAAAFYPKPVIVRFSDFKSNEYRNLVGGTYFEPIEENPMLGFRGASRYYDRHYKEAFALECAAIKKVREVMGLYNVKVMVPFVRTVPEAERVLAAMKEYGLAQHVNDLAVIMMCEIPSNVILIDVFSALFDGFSIGSNDLTQLTLGVDRDSGLLAGSFDERDPAVMKMMEMAIAGAQHNKKPIGICGQAPSDHPAIADFLIQRGIDSLSLNPDSVIPFLLRFRKK